MLKSYTSYLLGLLSLCLSPISFAGQGYANNNFRLNIKGFTCPRVQQDSFLKDQVGQGLKHLYTGKKAKPANEININLVIVDEDRHETVVYLPKRGKAYGKITAGKRIKLNRTIWRGPAQNLDFQILAWEIDNPKLANQMTALAVDYALSQGRSRVVRGVARTQLRRKGASAALGEVVNALDISSHISNAIAPITRRVTGADNDLIGAYSIPNLHPYRASREFHKNGFSYNYSVWMRGSGVQCEFYFAFEPDGSNAPSAPPPARSKQDCDTRFYQCSNLVQRCRGRNCPRQDDCRAEYQQCEAEVMNFRQANGYPMWGAVVIDNDSVTYHNGAHESPDSAERAALAQCRQESSHRSSCKRIATFDHCAAEAISRSGLFNAIAQGNSPAEAKQNAVRQCENSGGQCLTDWVSCSDGMHERFERNYAAAEPAPRAIPNTPKVATRENVTPYGIAQDPNKFWAAVSVHPSFILNNNDFFFTGKHTSEQEAKQAALDKCKSKHPTDPGYCKSITAYTGCSAGAINIHTHDIYWTYEMNMTNALHIAKNKCDIRSGVACQSAWWYCANDYGGPVAATKFNWGYFAYTSNNIARVITVTRQPNYFTARDKAIETCKTTFKEKCSTRIDFGFVKCAAFVVPMATNRSEYAFFERDFTKEAAVEEALAKCTKRFSSKQCKLLASACAGD